MKRTLSLGILFSHLSLSPHRSAPFFREMMCMEQARQLRELLRRPGAIVAIGAHDALSARLIERAGFDAVWASGFAISAAQFALPDANVLSMTENLEVIRQMCRATNLPVIADIDNGYGNAVNVMRTITEYEAAGVAAISSRTISSPSAVAFTPASSANWYPWKSIAVKSGGQTRAALR